MNGLKGFLTNVRGGNEGKGQSTLHGLLSEEVGKEEVKQKAGGTSSI